MTVHVGVDLLLNLSQTIKHIVIVFFKETSHA